jgi:hypothetical protein
MRSTNRKPGELGIATACLDKCDSKKGSSPNYTQDALCTSRYVKNYRIILGYLFKYIVFIVIIIQR